MHVNLDGTSHSNGYTNNSYSSIEMGTVDNGTKTTVGNGTMDTIGKVNASHIATNGQLTDTSKKDKDVKDKDSDDGGDKDEKKEMKMVGIRELV